MRRICIIPALACVALAISGCTATGSTAPPVSAGTTVVSTPSKVVAVSDEAVHFGFEALDTLASALDAAEATGAIKRGSPKAKAIADGLAGTLQWFNTASRLQRTAGKGAEAYAAWQQAQAGLAGVRTALAQK